jgi:hypothetical protein
MARNFANTTDRIDYFRNAQTNTLTTESVAFWMKTTQATVNVQVWANWSGASRAGLGLILNNTSNKISAFGFDNTTQRFTVASTTSVNSGSWVHVAVTADRNNAGRNDIYINGISEANANSSAAWTTGASNYIILGDSQDTFWPTFVGDMAEVAHWANVKLTADEVATLAAGFSPLHVQPAALDHYAPLVNNPISIITPTYTIDGPGPTVTGTTVSEHPRIFA